LLDVKKHRAEIFGIYQINIGHNVSLQLPLISNIADFYAQNQPTHRNLITRPFFFIRRLPGLLFQPPMPQGLSYDYWQYLTAFNFCQWLF